MPATSKTGNKAKTTSSKPKVALTKLTKKDEEFIKKRLKNLLQKEAASKSAPKPSTSKSSNACSSGSCLTTEAKKKITLSSSKSPSCSSSKSYFKKKDDNVSKNKTNSTAKAKPKTATTKKKTESNSKSATKKTTTAKKTTTTAKKTTKTIAAKKKTSATSSSRLYSCSNGQCTSKPKPKPKPKPKSSTAGKVKCTTGGCFFLKASTNVATKTNSVNTKSKRKAPEVKLKTLPIKKIKLSCNSKTESTKALKTGKAAVLPKRKLKTNNNLKTTQSATKVKKIPTKVSATSIKTKPKTSTKTDPAKKAISKSSASCTPCEFSDSDDSDYSNDDDYSDDFSYSDDYTEFSDSDDEDDDDDGCGGFEPSRRGTSNNNKYDSYDSDSFDTASGESFIYKGGSYQQFKSQIININNKDAGNIVEESKESALVPVHSIANGQNPKSDDDDDDDEYSIGEEETEFSNDNSEENSLDDEISYEDSEYSPSDYSFNESSNDEDYHLPDSEAEDVYIRQGDAKIYPFESEGDINFDSDASSLQLIELSNNNSFKTFVEEKIDGNDSDNSCPQLVPIIQESKPEENLEENEFLYFCDSGSENIEQGPKMVAHIFNVSKEDCEKHKDESFGNTSFIREEKKYSFYDDAGVDSSLLEKITNKLENLDTSNYKIITTRKEEDRPCNNFLASKRDFLKDPGKIRTNVFNASMKNENHELQNNLENRTGSSAFFEEAFSDLTTLKRPQATHSSPDASNASTDFRDTITEKMPAFSSLFYNAINSRQVLLLLKDTLYICGTLKLRLIAGGVESFGYNPEINEVCEIFSPKGYSSVYIKPAKREIVDKNIIRLELTLLNDDFMKTDLTEILELFDETSDAIILLERNDRNQQVEMVRKYMRENLFPNMNCITTERPFYASEFILRCKLFMTSENALRINQNWKEVNVSKTSKILVIGGRGVGKSTLVRYLINRNLQKFKKFLLIDLDIGQPEVFVPQTISATLIKNPLLGPGYFRGINPERSYLFGDINVVLSPISYLKNVKELIEWCQKENNFKDIPWIINTMGYNKGFGSELISVITELLKPSDIIQIQCSREINNFDYNMTPEVIKSIPRNIFADQINSKEGYVPNYELFLFESLVTKTSQSDMTAKDMRFAMIISRLGAILAGSHQWLSDVRPVCAPIENLDIISFSEDNIEKEDLLDVINANLVYLCRKADKCIECYGLGIVRGIDHFQEKLYLLPSVQFSILQNVNCLAVCNIPLPTSIILNQGPKIKDIAPYTYNTKDFVASKHINQICYRPQQFFQHTPRSVL